MNKTTVGIRPDSQLRIIRQIPPKIISVAIVAARRVRSGGDRDALEVVRKVRCIS